ncbi:MAG: protein kinase [Candidatus Pacebacteria bacterium]|nr:protein kinase [Candidatus Paceibacterota bacterium]
MKIYESFEDDHKFYIVMELMHGENLMSYITHKPQSSFNEKTVASIIKQVLSGLCNCHANNIAHRDIKPDNIMFADKECTQVKLIDFGFAKMFDPANSKFQELLGSPLYMAPEICSKRPYDLKCDIWSCGIICYILLTGEVPYKVGENTPLASLLDQIKSKTFCMSDISGPTWAGLSVESKQFILKMLTKDPERRATAQELLADCWLENAKEARPDAGDVKKQLQNLLNRAVSGCTHDNLGGNRQSTSSSMRSSLIWCSTQTWPPRSTSFARPLSCLTRITTSRSARKN